MAEKLRAAVLGATGLVGQRFVARLSRHPWFELEGLYASPEKAGMRYGDAVQWLIDEEPEAYVWEERLRRLDPDSLAAEGFDVVFSALPSSVAREVEAELARLGARVVSNASVLRMEGDVPLLNPEVNAGHASLVELQARRGWRGWIAKVPNCTTAILTLALKPLHDSYGIRRVAVVSMQAVSGAGLRGVPSTLIIDNLIPHIPGEEEKVEAETRKILGTLSGGAVEPARFGVTATATRVPVLDGHTEAVFVELEKPPESVAEAARVMEEFRGNQIRGMGLPSAPEKPLIVRREEDRPQPRLDRGAGGGMAVSVGRIRVDPVTGGLKIVITGHNTIRGAAGLGVLIGELMHRLGYL